MPESTPKNTNIRPLRIADAVRGRRHVFVRDLELSAEIGVHRHEKGRRQSIRINVDLSVIDDGKPLADSLANVVDYERVVDGIRDIIARGHVKLVESLAERIADLCLKDRRVDKVCVRIEKLAAFPDALSVGVEIERLAPKR